MSAERMQFKTELKQLLSIIIHSLYSNKEIFLRELISNASDAIDKVRFESLTKHDLLEGNSDWKIKLIADEAAGTLTIRDNGIGMNRESIVEHLGTIAKSGTRNFLEELSKADAKTRPELIGQFGVGFYSSFMVADTVTVVSREAGKPTDGVMWTSDAQGEFTVENVEKETRGTDVILHFREEDKEFLKPWKLRELIKTYSDFVEHPITMDVEQTDENKNKTITEETLNARKAIWLRPKNEITADEYADFYKHISHDTEAPSKTVHYSAEGNIEFRALVYVPKHKPFNMMWGGEDRGLQLYIRRVFIMDKCETLLPRYMRFIKGVVDSPDLPLNVSRELIQKSPLLEKIKTNLVSKILSTFEEMKSKDYDTYADFFGELGEVLKEGISQDFLNRERLAGVCLFKSMNSASDKWTTLDDYIAGLKEGQTEILYLVGETREQLLNSPYLEAPRAAGQDVILLSDPVDEFMVDSLREFKGKKLRALDKGALSDAKVSEEKQATFKTLLDFAKSRVTDVKDVRLSPRLKESAACLVADEGEMSAHMERLMSRIGQGGMGSTAKRVLELNPEHPAVEAVRALYASKPDDPRVGEYLALLYDQAVIGEGSKVKDPVAFAKRINALLAKEATS